MKRRSFASESSMASGTPLLDVESSSSPSFTHTAATAATATTTGTAITATQSLSSLVDGRYNNNNKNNNNKSNNNNNMSSTSLPQLDAAEDALLEFTDVVDDTLDELTYQTAVPINIQLSIENDIFGWSHLSSTILGHVVFTVVPSAIVYGVCKYWMHLPTSMALVLATLVGWAFFKLVRRRRKVWLLGSEYGSKTYLSRDRRSQLKLADETNDWLVQLRQSRARRKQHKKLLVADTQFQSRRQLLQQQQQPSPSSVTSHRGSNAGMNTSSIDTYDSTDNNHYNYNNNVNVNETTSTIHATTPLKHQNSSTIHTTMHFQTESIHTMHSVQDDQIEFTNGPIITRPYFHGGGFGAAPFLLANPHWISILRKYLPDVYIQLSRRIARAHPRQLIHWAENNPVVAAYATAQCLEYQQQQQQSNYNHNKSRVPMYDNPTTTTTTPTTTPTIANIEWDVFLDPKHVHSVQVVLQERRQFLYSVLPELPTTRPMEPLWELPQLSSSQNAVLQYLGHELNVRVQLLVDELLIAHGSLMQLCVEQTGWFKSFNYSRVKRTRRTLGGGMFARSWMSVYAAALQAGAAQQPPTGWVEAKPYHDTSFSSLECPNTTMVQSIQILKQLFCKSKTYQPFGLYLDVKSRHVDPEVWGCVVDGLRHCGVVVHGVGSFAQSEVRDLSQYTLQPVLEVFYFHSAGDVQEACHKKAIRFGDTVFFNAGSLVWRNEEGASTWQKLCGSFDPDKIKQNYRLHPWALPSTNMAQHSLGGSAIATAGSALEDYKRRYNLNIGLYVQEFAIDNAAVDLLVDLVNSHPEIYNLGLSWGGINGITLRGIDPGRFTDTSGFWNQRHVGAVWDSSLRPPV